MNRRDFLTTSSAMLAASAAPAMRPARAQQARATVLRFMTTNLKYEGLFSIEAYGQPAVTNIYNIILDTI